MYPVVVLKQGGYDDGPIPPAAAGLTKPMTRSTTKKPRSKLLLLAMASMAAQVWAAAPSSPQGVITARTFNEISGTALTDLTTSPKFPNNPDQIAYLPYFELNPSGDISIGAVDTADNYGGQIVGYFYPPTSGEYVFYLSSDDNGSLYLSTDENPANKKLIAREAGWSGVRSYTAIGGASVVEEKNSQTFTGTEWPAKDTANGGARINLVANRPYYIEALFKEGGGGDNLSVAVQDPNFAIDASMPIPGQYLSTIDKSGGPVKIATQPQSQTVDAGSSATFTVIADGTPPYTYQWSKDNTAIPDATNASYTLSRVSIADNNAKFKVTVTGAQGSITSSEAVLTVNPDNTPPGVVLASTTLGKTVLIEFNEMVEPASATNKANYSIPGITINDASISEDGKTVTLTITGNLPANFEVTMGGIKDYSGNAIPANTKATGYTTGLAPNMVSYWPMDVIEGTKTPDIISGYDLNLENLSAANLVDGRFGKCFEFDNSRKALLKRVHGTNDLLPIYNHRAFTVSVWVNGPVQTDHRIYCESSSKANNPMFSIGTHNGGSDGTLDTFIRNNSGTTTGDHHHHTGVVMDDTWHHICYVQNSNATPRAIVYIDGVRDDVNPDPIWPMTIDTTAIGAIQRAASAAWFTGKIDDVAVWSRALDPDEVSFLFTKGTPTPPPKVLPLTISSFQADLPAVAKGDSVTLRWDVSKDATSVEIQPDLGNVTAITKVGVGSTNVTVNTSKTYRMTIKRNGESLTSEIKVAAIDGVASNWSLLDNFDRYATGGLPKPWGVSGAGVTVVDVNGNRMLSVGGGGDSLTGLVLNDLTVKEGQQRTLFARFYLAREVTAGGISQFMGLSDKGIRFYSDSTGNLGPDVGFQNPNGPLEIGTWNGSGAAFEPATFELQPQTPYNLWINVRNDPIADGDLVSIFIAKEGTATRTPLFTDYRSDRSPEDTSLLGPTAPDLDVLTVAGNTANSVVYFDDFYLSKSGYNTTVPKVFGFTTPIEDAAPQAPTITAVRKDAGNCKFDILTQNGRSYIVESRDSLSSGSWQTAQTVPGTGQSVSITLPISGGYQFYRIRVQ